MDEIVVVVTHIVNKFATIRRCEIYHRPCENERTRTNNPVNRKVFRESARFDEGTVRKTTERLEECLCLCRSIETVPKRSGTLEHSSV